MNTEIPETSGVYVLRHTVTGECYVGSAGNLRRRLGVHLTNIRHGKRLTRRLRVACQKHGPTFEVKVLEQTHHSERRDAERRWIKKLSPSLNAAMVNDFRGDRPVAVAISVTLSVANLDALAKIADEMEFRPSMSQLINRALDQWLERQRSK